MITNYLDGLDNDLKESLLEQLRVLWTHNSTAIEGNTLTLGETHQVLTEGLTISGKPIAHHNEVIGHAKAIDIVKKLADRKHTITSNDLFNLHKAIQSKVIIDAYYPIGAWKNEPNSTSIVLDNKQIINDTYAWPEDVPELMERWINEINTFISKSDKNNLIKVYAWLHASFARIHPFVDGNGRLSRLLANLPLIAAGQPPVVITFDKRSQYFQTLARWQLSIGRPERGSKLVIENSEYKDFEALSKSCWSSTLALVEKAHSIQKEREKKRTKSNKAL